MVDNVLQFRAPPKTMERPYKKHKYTVTYLPDTKEWKWTVEVTHKTVYSDVAPTQVKAFRAAERHIDGVLRLQGAV
jgi:hypothetical protein